MDMYVPPSARLLTAAERELVELARRTIDAGTDVGPDEDGIHTVGAAVLAGDARMFAGVNLYHFTGGPAPSWSRSARPGPRARGRWRASSRWATTGAG